MIEHKGETCALQTATHEDIKLWPEIRFCHTQVMEKNFTLEQTNFQALQLLRHI